MMKKGFTLAEVLITLSIIGVVSALTLPNLSSGYMRQTTATQLSKAINTLENANALALQENFVSDLRNIHPNNYYNSISNFIKATPRTLTLGSYTSYRDFSNTNSLLFNNRPAFDTKDGMTFIQSGGLVSVPPHTNRSAMYSGSYYQINVDINGNTKGPNVIGRDTFILLVDTAGSVIPLGGRQYLEYNTPGSNDNPKWMFQCTKDTVSVNSGESCAGAIVDNGYVVNYF